ncbi:hypothetical protein MtrunA17_Chr5g0422591 [Medicago truncatula]|uniref:Uncharacterized protein n=1 Tax=Medicago truncatula TaxID=3880 RepID=A0A396HTG9_MEDTR|nr:hypothetical protein MtrunA17_Chr5g0422591 [Medicago truncatula]
MVVVVGIALEALKEIRWRAGGGSPDPVSRKKMAEVRERGKKREKGEEKKE